MQFAVKEKFALITGGATGIGYYIGKELFKHGLKGLAIVDVNETKGTITKDEFNKEFGPSTCIFIKTDVSDDKQLEDAFKLTVETFKHLDIVINNAGILDEVNWKKCIDINLRGCIVGTKLAIDNYLPKYKSGDEGVLINISSIAGLAPEAPTPVYTACKYGLIALSRSFGVKEHYERTKVRVLCVCPGLTETDMTGNFKVEQLEINFQGDYKPEAYTHYLSQMPDVFAKYLMDVVKTGTHGSTWVIENGQPPYEIDFSKSFKVACIMGTKFAIDTYLTKYLSGSEGVIINIAGLIGIEVMCTIPVYTTTKHGVVGFSRAYGVKEYYDKTKVKVLTICPGMTRTAMSTGKSIFNIEYEKMFKNDEHFQDFPLQEPDFLANAILDILKNGQNGSVWVVNGGKPHYEVEFTDRLNIRKE